MEASAQATLVGRVVFPSTAVVAQVQTLAASVLVVVAVALVPRLLLAPGQEAARRVLPRLRQVRSPRLRLEQALRVRRPWG